MRDTCDGRKRGSRQGRGGDVGDRDAGVPSTEQGMACFLLGLVNSLSHAEANSES